MEFQNQKSQRLEHVDLSRKGSVDEPVFELVTYINSLPRYFTTSSCSGRTILFESAIEAIEDDENSQTDKREPSNQMKIGKKGCKWLFVSHNIVSPNESEDSLSKVASTAGNVVFKFEAMVMHIQCQTLEDAQKMHQAAVAAGFRNSGISIGGKRKIILGVRSTHGLEAPLTKLGRMLVTPEYYEYLVECANCKMEENFIRINRFFENVKAMSSDQCNATKKGGKRSKTERKRTGCTSFRNQNKETAMPSPYSNDDSSVLCDDNAENDKDEFPLFMFENT